jgi:hypothetical protein
VRWPEPRRGIAAVLTIVCWASYHEAAMGCARLLLRFAGDWRQEWNPSCTEPPNAWVSKEVFEFKHPKKPEFRLALNNHFGERSIGFIGHPHRVIWFNPELTIWSDYRTCFKVNNPDVNRVLWQISLNVMPKRELDRKRRRPAMVHECYRDVAMLRRCPSINDCASRVVFHLKPVQSHNWHFRPHNCGGVQTSCSGGLSSCVRGFFSVVNTLPHQAQLPEKQCDLTSRNERQKQSEPSQNPSRSRQPPFIRRMLVCAALFLADLCLALWGGENLYRKRYLIGAAVIAGGGLLACIGLGLLWATWLPSTWGWWF